MLPFCAQDWHGFPHKKPVGGFPGTSTTQIVPGLHCSQLVTRAHPVVQSVQTVPVPSARSPHSQPLGQLGVHIGSPPEHTPSTHSCPSAQRLEQLPRWFSFLLRLTHLSLQRVLPSGQPQTLSSPPPNAVLRAALVVPPAFPSQTPATVGPGYPGEGGSAAPRSAPPT
jgi:hypothetical protein